MEILAKARGSWRCQTTFVLGRRGAIRSNSHNVFAIGFPLCFGYWMKLTALVVSLACVIGAAPGVAHAQCMAPHVEFSPSTGNLPRRATIYLFVPIHDAGGAVSSPDAKLVVKRVAISPAFHVYEIVVAANHGNVTVRYQPPRNPSSGDQPVGAQATYVIGEAPPNTARVTDVAHVERAWGCSHTNTIQLAVEGTAIAYRFNWHSSPDVTFVPASDPQIGHLNCIGDNVEPSKLAETRGFDLHALFADGSTRQVGSAKARLDSYSVRLPMELLGREPAEQVAPACNVAELREPVEVEDSRSWFELLGGLAGLGALVAASVLARRTRTPAS